MSYDLYFTEPQISREQFADYFGRRSCYELKADQALYQNPDTGVYFIFDYNDGEEESEEPSGNVSFNLNYFRPHFFGLEAAPELEAFVAHFGLSIHDPQDQGMGDGPFSIDGFLKSWNAGNEFGYSAMLRQEGAGGRIWTWPGERLEAAWRWNHAKGQVQERLGEETFVPAIFLLAINEAPASVAVWPDAISELIPEVDYLMVGRDELAPRNFFGLRKKDSILIPFDQCGGLLSPYQTPGHSLPAYHLPPDDPSAKARGFVKTLQATGIDGEGLPYDQVLNEEIVRRVSAKG